MKICRKLLAVLLTVVMLTGVLTASAGAEAVVKIFRSDTPTTDETQVLNGGTAVIHTSADGSVFFVDGSCSDGPIHSAADAEAVVDSMLTLLGGNERTHFEHWRTIGDAAGNQYYIFRQMYAGITVSGGAIKVVTDPQGNMLGLVCSVESGIPDAEESKGITAEQAEAVVIRALSDGGREGELVEGVTARTILPVNLELDPYSEEEKEESRYVWVVYTRNVGGSVVNGGDLPYLAHYVAMDGEYLYSMPTVVPGDDAGRSGFDASYAFEFMEPVDYTGTVTLKDGSEREISVTLMRDRRTGMYYLGDPGRRIVVADCYEFLYGGGRVVMESSPDNSGWDETSLLSLYNYCRAWDYYDAIGWTGGDGLGTPTLILKDYCDEDHNPVDNAAYAGCYLGWQIFLSSSANDYARCLDVLAHEFTHCVTGSVMTYNAYQNDYGAINEGISDIQGNLCQMMMEGAGDPLWEIGEDADAVRSMSDPHMFGQPEYTWDIYYASKVKVPTDINDRGGVHSNSSLINNVAWRLCDSGGMTLEQARAYWFAVDCSMVPGTDYAQLSELLPWVMRNQGMEEYLPTLEAALEAVRLDTDALPDAFDEDRALVTLTLPDTELMTDGNWVLIIISVDIDGIIERCGQIAGGEGKYEHALDELAEIFGVTKEQLMNWSLSEEGGDQSPTLPDDVDPEDMAVRLAAWARTYLGEVFYFGTGGAGEDGRTIRMVCRSGIALPILMRFDTRAGSEVPESFGMAAYVFGSWFDLSGFFEDIMEIDAGTEAAPEDPSDLSGLLEMLGLDGQDGNMPDTDEMDLTALLNAVSDLLGGMRWLLDLVFFRISGGGICEISAAGLEEVSVIDGELLETLFAPETADPDTDGETAPDTGESGPFEFHEWNGEAPALAALREYVEAVTDPDSPDFIPVEDRVAVFDLDGTLYGELAPVYGEWWMFVQRVLYDADFTADDEMIAVAREIEAVPAPGQIPPGLEVRQAQQNARAYSGMTLDEYDDYVDRFLLTGAVGFDGMTYSEAFYLPMLEVIDYLNKNDFTVYICSGSDRFFCRALAEGRLDVPADRIIGMDVRLEGQDQQGVDGPEYDYTPDECIVRTDELMIRNVSANKPAQIAQEIGRQPVLSFGNSTADTSMAMYVTGGNRYRSAAFMLVADDDVRDYGDPEKAASLRGMWESFGWHVISMKDDFRTIYGDGVVKTGS